MDHMFAKSLHSFVEGHIFFNAAVNNSWTVSYLLSNPCHANEFQKTYQYIYINHHFQLKAISQQMLNISISKM